MNELQLPEKPTDDLSKIKDTLIRANKKAHIVGAVTEIRYIPPSYQLVFRSQHFDSEFDREQDKARSNGRWYKVEGGKYALHKSALDKLASLAGVSVIENETVKVAELVWRSKVTVQLKEVDGKIRKVTKTKEVDLREGEHPIQLRKRYAKLNSSSFEAKQIKKKLNRIEHAPAMCETKAHCRALRSILGIQAAYSKEEAKKPFVCASLMWAPPSSPEMERMIAAVELGIVDQVYGSPPIRSAPQPLQVEVDPADKGDHLDLYSDDFEEDPPTGEEPHEEHVQPTCSVCSVVIHETVHDFSVRRFRKPLCREHQPKR